MFGWIIAALIIVVGLAVLKFVGFWYIEWRFRQNMKRIRKEQ